jgi:hypothetical protein
MARTEYARVRAMTNPPDALSRTIESTSDDPDQAMRRLAKALVAVGEAYFADAEAQRVEAERIAVGSPRDAQAFKVQVEKKRSALERAERAYVAVLEIKPVPPPTWTVTSAARVALMWSGFVDELRRAAPQMSHAALDEIVEPIKAQRAKPALRRCVTMATMYEEWSDDARACEAWLAKNYKAEYHLVDEAVPPLHARRGARFEPVRPP